MWYSAQEHRGSYSLCQQPCTAQPAAALSKFLSPCQLFVTGLAAGFVPALPALPPASWPCQGQGAGSRAVDMSHNGQKWEDCQEAAGGLEQRLCKKNDKDNMKNLGKNGSIEKWVCLHLFLSLLVS